MSDLDITSLSTELSVEPKESKQTESPKEETVVEAKEVATKPEDTIEALESLSEKTEDAIPLKKYMVEKHARRDAEAKAKELEAELVKLRENPYKSNQDIKVDVKTLSEKHNIDEEVLSDILNASYNMTKEKVKEELERELSPKLAEFEQIKKEKVKNEFETKFNSLLESSIKEMPEYADLIDKDDLKTWVKSGQYSKLSLPQLIEQKYGKFVGAKKTIETSHAAKQVDLPDVTQMTDQDYINLDKDPELKAKWKSSLEDRLRKYM